MHRRHFLLALATLLISPRAFSDMILHGSSAEDGQRNRRAWLNVTTKLTGLRLAKPNEQIQFVVFFDPNCPACADFWQWFSQHSPRQYSSLWIPVAYMNVLSTAKSIALLRAIDPYAAMAQNYKDFNRQLRQGHIVPAENISLKETAAVQRNTRYWNEQMFGMTPLVLYRKNDGTYWQQLGFYAPTMETVFANLAPANLTTYSAK